MRSGRSALIASVVLAFPAAADKVADFKRAARSNGIGLIPYGDSRTQASRAQERVTKWCKRKSLECKGNMKKPELSQRLTNAKNCLASRQQVEAVFAGVKQKLRRETKPVKPYADQIIAAIAAGEPGHRAAIRDYQAAVANCERLLR